MKVWDFRPLVANPGDHTFLYVELNENDLQAVRDGDKLACELPDGNGVIVRKEDA